MPLIGSEARVPSVIHQQAVCQVADKAAVRACEALGSFPPNYQSHFRAAWEAGSATERENDSSAKGWGAQGGVRLQFEREKIPVASREVRKVTEPADGWGERLG